MGKTVTKSFKGKNLQQMTKLTVDLCFRRKFDLRVLSAPAPGLYHVYNYYFQISSQKLLCQSKPNFMWNVGHQFINMVFVT